VTAWLCEFACDDGFGGFLRLDVRPTIAWYWTYLVNVPGVDGVIAVRDHEVPPPRTDRLEIRAEGLWAELWCEQPGEHWTFGMEAFGLRLEGDDVRDEIGERVPVGLDLEWELGDVVHGDVLVGRDRFAVDARGRFVEGHELIDEPLDGPVVARVPVAGLVERTLVRTGDGLRWAQHVTGE
jgi:hypothetical protein